MASGGELRPRDASAQATRRRILEAAAELLRSGGYPAMTVATLAASAGVSPQTVYNSVGGKAQVVKAVYDTMLAGDVDPTPMSERAAFRRMTEAADIAEWATAYAAWSRGIHERTGPLLGVLLAEGDGGDPVLRKLMATIDNERRRGNLDALRGLAARKVVPRGRRLDRLVDTVWVLTSPEVYDRLVRRCGWRTRDYERWLAGQLRTAAQAVAG